MFGTYYLNPTKLDPKGVLVHSIIAMELFYIGGDTKLIADNIQELFIRVQVAHHLHRKMSEGQYNGAIGLKRRELDKLDLESHFANSPSFQQAPFLAQLDKLQADGPDGESFRLHNTVAFFTVEGYLAYIAEVQASLATYLKGKPFVAGVPQSPMLYNQDVAWFLPKTEDVKLQNCQ